MDKRDGPYDHTKVSSDIKWGCGDPRAVQSLENFIWRRQEIEIEQQLVMEAIEDLILEDEKRSGPASELGKKRSAQSKVTDFWQTPWGIMLMDPRVNNVHKKPENYLVEDLDYLFHHLLNLCNNVKILISLI